MIFTVDEGLLWLSFIKYTTPIGCWNCAVVHQRRALLKERHHLQGWYLREESLVRRTPIGVGLGRRSVKAVRSPKNNLQLQTVTISAVVGDSREINANKIGRILRRAARPPFMVRQIALSTTVVCCG